MSQPLHPEPATREPSRGQLTTYALGALVVVVVAFAAGLLPRMRQRAAVFSETGELAVPTVILVSPVRSTSSAAIRLPAEIKALTEAPILARATGYVRAFHVDIGSKVTQGQLLAELETPELNQQLASARALKQQADAALNLARTTAARWQEMRQSKVVSAQEADEKAADAELKLAGLHSAAAEVSRLEELVGFARITAPFEGVVTSRRTDIGQLVVAGSGVELFRIAQTHTLRVFVRLPQTLSSSARPGVVAQVLLSDDGGSPRRVEAKLVRTSGAVDPASRTLLTELELPNPDGTMLPGGFAQIEFPDVSTNQALAIPANTILFRPEGLTVAVVDATETVEMRRIVPGRDMGALVEVLSGINPDSRLVLNPPDSLATGMKVRLAAGAGAKPDR